MIAREQTQMEMLADLEADRAAKRRARDERQERRRQTAKARKVCQGLGHDWNVWARPERLSRGWEGRQRYWHGRTCRRCARVEGYTSEHSQAGAA